MPQSRIRFYCSSFYDWIQTGCLFVAMEGIPLNPKKFYVHTANDWSEVMRFYTVQKVTVDWHINW